MAPSDKPKAVIRRQSSRERPPTAGRQTATSITAANSTLRKTVPPAPTSSKRDFASAAPNCTDETATTTRTVGGIRSARTMARDRTQPQERTYEELERIFADVDAPFAFVDLDALW